MYKNVAYRQILTILFCLVFVNNIDAQEDEFGFGSIKTVVIDAGHGGKDPGCHGSFAQEKHVCLSMALKLGAMIEKVYPEINVIYTREKDVFVELNDRAKIANENNADLFICIHANAAGPTAYGTETFVLGLHRTDAQQKVAERENSTIYLEEDGGEKYAKFEMTPDAIIARQIQLSLFLDQSINFASKLQREFKGIGRHDRGVKQAGFLVLYKTTMPSVLIETGFLTNPKEEKFLGDPEKQELMAGAMFKAFQKYKNELEGIDGEVQEHEVVEEKPEVQTGENPFVEKKDVVIFKVQVETSEVPVNLNHSKFKGKKIEEYKHQGLYKYTVGAIESDFKSANNLKSQLREEGFKHAFVVAFLNGERISLQKGINFTQK